MLEVSCLLSAMSGKTEATATTNGYEQTTYAYDYDFISCAMNPSKCQESVSWKWLVFFATHRRDTLCFAS